MRNRGLVRRVKVPWRMALAVTALFVIIDAALQLGLQPALASLAGEGTSDAPARLMALLIGVNVAPLVTPWASLATLLWAQRCRARGIHISAKSLALQGLLCDFVSAGLALGALVVVS